jgi:hypothetical protein
MDKIYGVIQKKFVDTRETIKAKFDTLHLK